MDWTALPAFLARSDNLALLGPKAPSQQRDWLWGGCAILAEALLEWLPSHAQLWTIEDPEALWAYHMLVGVNGHFIDGLGERTQEEVLAWFAQEYPATSQDCILSDCERDWSHVSWGGIIRNPKEAHLLAERLLSEFGSVPALDEPTLA
jgi:hypothetical protein